MYFKVVYLPIQFFHACRRLPFLDQISHLFPQLKTSSLLEQKASPANLFRHAQIQLRPPLSCGWFLLRKRTSSAGRPNSSSVPAPSWSSPTRVFSALYEVGQAGPSPSLSPPIHHIRAWRIWKNSANQAPGGAHHRPQPGGRPADSAPEGNLSWRHHAQANHHTSRRRRRTAASHQHLPRPASCGHGGLRLPEWVTGAEPAFTPGMDIYALGLTLYILLTRTTPLEAHCHAFLPDPVQ